MKHKVQLFLTTEELKYSFDTFISLNPVLRLGLCRFSCEFPLDQRKIWDPAVDFNDSANKFRFNSTLFFTAEMIRSETSPKQTDEYVLTIGMHECSAVFLW